MKFIKERLLTSKEIITIWLIVLVLVRVADGPLFDDLAINIEPAWTYVLVREPSPLLWLAVLTLLSFFARKHMKINVFTSFVLVSVISSILIPWGSFYAWILYAIVYSEIRPALAQYSFLFGTASPALLYLHYRIMTAPLEDDIQNKLAILKPIFSVQSYRRNIKVYCVGIIMWGYTIAMSANLLFNQMSSWKILITYSLVFGTAWFVCYCLICLYFRYVVFQRQAELPSRIAFTFAASYLLASLFAPIASLSIQNIFQMGLLKWCSFFPLEALLPPFFILAFYFNALIQEAK